MTKDKENSIKISAVASVPLGRNVTQKHQEVSGQQENQKTTNDFKKSKPDQKSIDSIDQQKRKSTNKLQDVKVIVCTNKI